LRVGGAWAQWAVEVGDEAAGHGVERAVDSGGAGGEHAGEHEAGDARGAVGECEQDEQAVVGDGCGGGVNEARIELAKVA